MSKWGWQEGCSSVDNIMPTKWHRAWHMVRFSGGAHVTGLEGSVWSKFLVARVPRGKHASSKAGAPQFFPTGIYLAYSWRPNPAGWSAGDAVTSSLGYLLENPILMMNISQLAEVLTLRYLCICGGQGSLRICFGTFTGTFIFSLVLLLEFLWKKKILSFGAASLMEAKSTEDRGEQG